MTAAARRSASNAEVQRLHDEIAALRQQGDDDRRRIQALESELARGAQTVIVPPGPRTSFEQALRIEQSRAKRQSAALSLALLELDDHPALDGATETATAAAHVCHVLSAAARPTDVVAPLDAARVALLLPATALDQALAAIARLQLAVAEQRFAPAGLTLTCSGGVVQWRHDEAVDDLLARASHALQLARQAGPNKLVAA